VKTRLFDWFTATGVGLVTLSSQRCSLQTRPRSLAERTSLTRPVSRRVRCQAAPAALQGRAPSGSGRGGRQSCESPPAPRYGPDLDSIDRALKRAFARCRIDPRLIAIGGFSDGAGNALTLGLVNGDLFRAVIALAPGALIADGPVGKPRVFIAHGRGDTTIPIRASDEIVRKLRASRYAVMYRTFGGGHEVPDAISKTAVRWFLRG
jgi:predicted esterase